MRFDYLRGTIGRRSLFVSPQEKLDMILQYRWLEPPLIPLRFFPSSLMWVNTTSCALIITFCIFLTRCVLLNENVLLCTSWKSGIHYSWLLFRHHIVRVRLVVIFWHQCYQELLFWKKCCTYEKKEKWLENQNFFGFRHFPNFRTNSEINGSLVMLGFVWPSRKRTYPFF